MSHPFPPFGLAPLLRRNWSFLDQLVTCMSCHGQGPQLSGPCSWEELMSVQHELGCTMGLWLACAAAELGIVVDPKT